MRMTLARMIGEAWPGPYTHFDLEKPSDLACLADPQLALEPLEGLVVLDEIQRPPDLFPLLRVLAVLGIGGLDDLTAHPVAGASWEGFATEQVIRALGTDPRHRYFWAVHSGGEIDLVVEDGSRLLGFEFKRTLSPKLTRSLRSAVETLGPSETTIVYPGTDAYDLAESVRVRPLTAFGRT